MVARYLFAGFFFVIIGSVHGGEQLLLNPAFDGEQINVWHYSQHAGPLSYEYEMKDEVLSIRRTGVEPWGIVAQQVPAQMLIGKKLILTAEVQADFVRSDGPVFEPASVRLSVYGWPANPALRFMGLQRLVEQRFVLPQALPGNRWSLVELALDAPDGAVSVEVSFVMGYDGEMRVRKPVLRFAEPVSSVN